MDHIKDHTQSSIQDTAPVVLQPHIPIGDDPSTWPVLKHIAYLFSSISQQTAFYQTNYPYGREGRCIRRCWAEQATKGSGKGRWRLMHQTTSPYWNADYNEHIVAAKQSTEEKSWAYLQDWVQQEITGRLASGYQNARSLFWNKAQHGTYHPFCVWEQVIAWPSEESFQQNLTAKAKHILMACCWDINTKREVFEKFLAKIYEHKEQHLINEAQRKGLYSIESIGRTYNPSEWTQQIQWEKYGLVKLGY